MAISIYKLFQHTFKDYKRDYFHNLNEFLNEFEDNNELYFIKEQKSILEIHLGKFKEVVINLVDEDENKDEILDLFRNRINTTDRIKEFLETRKQELENESSKAIKHVDLDCKIKSDQQSGAVKLDEVTSAHPKHDPNYWNADCYDLFKYLFDEYYKGTKRQLTNIWFYLKEHENKKYILNATKDFYKDFIKENYNIVITNFDKAIQKWEDKECKKIDEHRQVFEGNFKQIAENAKNT